MSHPLTFVCWRWKPQRPPYRSTFTPNTVSVMKQMIARHYALPHRFICVTDAPDELDSAIETYPLWPDHHHLPPPQGGKNPSCYVRLKMYSAEMRDIFGPRFVSIDLDAVVVGDLVPLFDRPEDFVIWGDTNRNTYYNGGLVMMNAGCRRKVWDDFDPVESPRRAVNAQCFGSDQAWVSYRLGPGEAKWSKADGVYSFRNDFRMKGVRDLPANARLVMFHGAEDPWLERTRRDFPWVGQHWVGEGATCGV